MNHNRLKAVLGFQGMIKRRNFHKIGPCRRNKVYVHIWVNSGPALQDINSKFQGFKKINREHGSRLTAQG
jgi:hypothetical protein